MLSSAETVTTPPTTTTTAKKPCMHSQCKRSLDKKTGSWGKNPALVSCRHLLSWNEHLSRCNVFNYICSFASFFFLNWQKCTMRLKQWENYVVGGHVLTHNNYWWNWFLQSRTLASEASTQSQFWRLWGKIVQPCKPGGAFCSTEIWIWCSTRCYLHTHLCVKKWYRFGCLCELWYNCWQMPYLFKEKSAHYWLVWPTLEKADMTSPFMDVCTGNAL